MHNCKFTTEEVNLIKRALDKLHDQAKAVEGYGFDVGTIKEEIYEILRKINEVQNEKS